MLLELALVVLGSSIVVFFSEELGGLLKKLFAIRGVKLFLPLVLASWFVDAYEPWVWWGLIGLKKMLHQTVYGIQWLIPWQWGSQQIATILLLIFLSLGPVYAINYWVKRKNSPYYQFKRRWLVSIVLWITFSILLTVSFIYP